MNECCGGRKLSNFTSYPVLMKEIFGDAIWSLFGEMGELTFETTGTEQNHIFEFVELILGIMKGIYMLASVIILLNLLIAMFSYSFTRIQEQSHRIWCLNKHNLIFEYYDRSKWPPPLAIFSILRRFFLFSGCCKHLRQKCGFISSKRSFKVRLMKKPAWADDGNWSSQFAKRLRHWERIIANDYWLSPEADSSTSTASSNR